MYKKAIPIQFYVLFMFYFNGLFPGVQNKNNKQKSVSLSKYLWTAVYIPKPHVQTV